MGGRRDGDGARARVAVFSLHTSPLDQPGTGDSGGMNVYIRAVAERLAAQGIEVDVFTRCRGRGVPEVEQILPGHRLELSHPELPEGARVEVIVVLPGPQPPRMAMVDFLKTLPPRPLLFPTPEDADRYLQEERDSWDR